MITGKPEHKARTCGVQIEEARAELAREKAAAAAQLAREQAGAAAAEASLSKLTAEHRTLITEAATLRAEVDLAPDPLFVPMTLPAQSHCTSHGHDF